MDPHRQTATSPRSMVSGLLKHRQLILQIATLEVEYRCKGFIFGLAWFFITPLTLLLIFTLVFSDVLKFIWGAQEVSGVADFALLFFVALTPRALIWGVISDVETSVDV